MTISKFAAVMGSLFLAVGVMGFADGFVSPPHADDPSLSVESNYGRLLGLFPINTLHNAVHVLVGVAGLLAWRNVWSPQAFAKLIGGFYAVLTVMGLIPGLHTMMGLVPIFGHDVWLHALSSALGIYFGWFYLPTSESRQPQRAVA
jgi:hypothetical protein